MFNNISYTYFYIYDKAYIFYNSSISNWSLSKILSELKALAISSFYIPCKSLCLSLSNSTIVSNDFHSNISGVIACKISITVHMSKASNMHASIAFVKFITFLNHLSLRTAKYIFFYIGMRYSLFFFCVSKFIYIYIYK